MNRSTPAPAASEYRETANTIRAQIESGKYPRGSQLPIEDVLAADLGVHRATVNRALRLLEAEGLVRVHRGKGRFVTELPPIRRNASLRYSRAARERAGGRGAFDAEIRALGREPDSRVTVRRVSVGDQDVPAAVDEFLSGDLLERSREMFADDIPAQLARSFVPLPIAEAAGLTDTDTGTGGMLSRLADAGHTPTRAREILTVRPPTEEERAFLRMTPDQRVIDLVRITWSNEGTPGEERVIEVTLHVQPSHAWINEYDLPVDSL